MTKSLSRLSRDTLRTRKISFVPRRAIGARPFTESTRHNANAAARGAPFDFVKIDRQWLEQDRSRFCDATPDNNDFGVEDIDERSDRPSQNSKRFFPDDSGAGVAGAMRFNDFPCGRKASIASDSDGIVSNGGFERAGRSEDASLNAFGNGDMTEMTRATEASLRRLAAEPTPSGQPA